MAGFKVEVKGLAELERRLREFGGRVVANGLRSSALAGTNVFLKAAKETVPVRTGTLQANIVPKRRRAPAGMATYSVVVRGVKLAYGDTPLNRRLRRVGRKYNADGPGFYGKFIEFGTSKMAARPFMRPAFVNNTQQAIAAVKANLQKAVERAAKRAG